MLEPTSPVALLADLRSSDFLIAFRTDHRDTRESFGLIVPYADPLQDRIAFSTPAFQFIRCLADTIVGSEEAYPLRTGVLKLLHEVTTHIGWSYRTVLTAVDSRLA